ncbi:Cd(II)/Pb(II)-responsive transcriptional regulator [Acinetobacter johnsonii]|uniref:Cd(II)/Pb(II)-responsive transcriptional regulator n=1 Tax=Acinetobacter sp. BMW17 TaxID=1795629 RepID=UPI0007825260|nr:Cd(II)/Pb(II)-responsive transcriptional regulator [Acinetobacter sp. BMW17]USI87536.1 Cd(II)/Pb(II)-responsive transcriptional regulator [Acinetobacter johnsonii]
MHLKIGELSKKTSCSVLTIRFYEKEGLIPEPERTEGNYRLYDIGYVERIKFILNCRTLNMSLNEIRQLLTYKDNPKKNCSDVNELIDLHVSAIRENLNKQQKLIEQLSDLRGTCDGLCTIDQCGVLKNLA